MSKEYKPPTSRMPEVNAPKQWSGQSIKSASDGPIGAGIELRTGLSSRAGFTDGGLQPGPVRLPNPGGPKTVKPQFRAPYKP
jgi:hypothetical protein